MSIGWTHRGVYALVLTRPLMTLKSLAHAYNTTFHLASVPTLLYVTCNFMAQLVYPGIHCDYSNPFQAKPRQPENDKLLLRLTPTTNGNRTFIFLLARGEILLFLGLLPPIFTNDSIASNPGLTVLDTLQRIFLLFPVMLYVRLSYDLALRMSYQFLMHFRRLLKVDFQPHRVRLP